MAGGLYLEVSPPGSKRWFWKYYFNGKEKRLALGSYADAQIAEGRDELAQGARGPGPGPRGTSDRSRPGAAAAPRQADKGRLCRDDVRGRSPESCMRSSSAGGASSTGSAGSSAWKRTSFPGLAGVPLKEITAPLLLQTLRRIESRGAHETAHTLRQTAGQVFRYGVATGRCDAKSRLRTCTAPCDQSSSSTWRPCWSLRQRVHFCGRSGPTKASL